MKNFNEKVATSNAQFKNEVIDFLTSTSGILDFGEKEQIKVNVDTTNGWVEVELNDICFTYLAGATPYVKFYDDFPYRATNLDTITDILNSYQEIWVIYDKVYNNTSTEDIEGDSIYKLFIMEKIGDSFNSNMELTETPAKRAKQIKDMWLVNMALNGYDTPNVDITNTDTTMVVNVISENNGSTASLVMSWDAITDYEYELIKGHIV